MPEHVTIILIALGAIGILIAYRGINVKIILQKSEVTPPSPPKPSLANRAKNSLYSFGRDDHPTIVDDEYEYHQAQEGQVANYSEGLEKGFDGEGRSFEEWAQSQKERRDRMGLPGGGGVD
jgi:hypothetical protein